MQMNQVEVNAMMGQGSTALRINLTDLMVRLRRVIANLTPSMGLPSITINHVKVGLVVVAVVAGGVKFGSFILRIMPASVQSALYEFGAWLSSKIAEYIPDVVIRLGNSLVG